MRARMATGPVRDDEQLAIKIEEWLHARMPDTAPGRVTVRHATVGFSNETLLVNASPARYVVRVPPLVPSYPEYDLHSQERVQNTLRDAGFPAPHVIAVEEDPQFLGAPFLVMEHVDGHVIDSVPGLDPWLGEQPATRQRALQQTFVDTLAALHALPWRGTALDGTLRRGLHDELAYWFDYVEWAGDGAPARRLTDALAWCRDACPTDEPEPAVLWGDARFGNVIFTDDRRVAAVIDWELATLGPPEMDLAWFLALEALTAKATGARVAGFDDRATVIASYEQHLGRAVVDLAWHEVFALVRSVAINDKLARLADATGAEHFGFGDDNPMLPYIARRIERYEVSP
jgi:aminoglycoside phosphotransferase (APT) family kinase protein